MKKIISLILALALAMSFSVTAFAAGDHSAEVTASYTPFEEEASIDIEWGSLSFVYRDGVADGGEARWEPAEDGANIIRLTNCSLATYLKVDFAFSFVDNAADLGLENVTFQWGRYDLDGANGESGLGNASTVLVTESVTNTETHHAEMLVLDFFNAPTKALDNVKIGEVTLTISEYVDGE